MGSANGGSGDTMPLRIVPERIEAPEDDPQSVTAKGFRILDDDETRAAFLDEPFELVPEPRFLAIQSLPFPNYAYVLTGEAAGQNVELTRFDMQIANVGMNPSLRPMTLQHIATVRFDLAKRLRRKLAVLFQPEREPSNPTKEVEHT